MALKDGRCPNCGSIVHLESSAPRGHCLFCDMVFDNSAAFAIAANPQGVDFPNEPQPPYEGPSLDFRSGGVAVQNSQRQKQVQQPAPKKTNIPAYVIKENKLPDLRLSHKTKLKFFGGAIALIAIVVAISAPLAIVRDQARSKLLTAMPAMASNMVDPATSKPVALDVTTDVSIRNQNNDFVIIATSANVTQQDAVVFFKAYCLKRAEVQNINTNSDAVYAEVTIKMATPTGGWLISNPQNLAALESGSGVTNLDK